MRTYCRIALAVLATLVAVMALCILFVHPGLYETDPPWTFWDHLLTDTVTILMGPVTPLVPIMERISVFPDAFWFIVGILIAAAIWAAPIYFVLLFLKKIPKPVTPPHGGPGGSLGHSGSSVAPPSGTDVKLCVK